MGLRVWDNLNDPYDHDQQADNLAKLDFHDHSPGRGVQVPTEGIINGAITAAKLAPDVAQATLPDNAVTQAKMADGSVGTAELLGLAVIEGKLAADSVSETKIQNLAVTQSKLALNSVTTNNIVDGTILTADLGDNQVTTPKVADSSITNAKLADFIITTAKLADGSVTTAKLANSSVVTALPAFPVDGQEAYYAADVANGVIWHLKYRAASPSVYKWEFVGGARLVNSVVAGRHTDETTSATVFTGAQPTTPGPSLTLPLAGDYDIELDVVAYHNTANIGMYMSFDVGATKALDDDAAYMAVGVASTDILPMHRVLRKTIPNGAQTLVCKYRTNAGIFSLRGPRAIAIQPVRVG